MILLRGRGPHGRRAEAQRPDQLSDRDTAQFAPSAVVGRLSVNGWQQSRWQQTTPPMRVAIQLAVLLLAVLVAYNYSLLTLVQNVGLETPLAYVSLVPLIALGLAGIRAQPNTPELAIYDRQVDYIIGLPLIAVAMLIEFALPQHFSVMFWVWRIDLLSMPLYVIGCVAIIFGTRMLWRQRLALFYLFLAWPLPWSEWLLGLLNGFTDVTLDALHVIVRVLHVATVVPGDGSIFSVNHGSLSFPLSVISACSGVNGVVGFVLVGGAFLFIVRGPRLRKTLWILGGMLLCWVMNLGRLTFIFWAGQLWGERVAIDILHPFIGLVTFGLGIVVMMLLLRPIGLSILELPALDLASRDARPSRSGAAPSDRAGALAVPKVLVAVAIVLVSSIFLGVADSKLRVYNLVANSSGEPTLTALTGEYGRLAAPPGWTGAMIAQYTWATPYFGDNSTWFRYSYEARPDAVPYSDEAVTVDVINTTDLDSFSAYGIVACYQFHGYQLRDIADVDLGGGVTGQTLSYTAGNIGTWSIVYWIVPVKNGTATHYERVVVYLANSSAIQVTIPPGTPGARNLSGSLSQLGPQGTLLYRNREFLIAFASSFLRSQAHESTHSATAGGTA